MRHYPHHYIGGQWLASARPRSFTVTNPATEEPLAVIAAGGSAEVDAAVRAAREAFDDFSRSSRLERCALLQRIIDQYAARQEELALALCEEMGCPISLARKAQVPLGRQHLETALTVLRDYPFEERRGDTVVLKEPIGVCGLITPWNWPLNQIACKVGPALAAGCTMVLKPSERTPVSAVIFAQIMHAAGVPPGVFNLVNGDGPDAGVPLSRHEGVDMVSFTGSTRAGVAVATNAAGTIKRVTQELGGKSPNIILTSADLELAVTAGVQRCFNNSGQTCTAPSRMLVPAARVDEAAAIATRAARDLKPGDPADAATTLGPVVCRSQYDAIQQLIAQGLAEGARLVTGGPGRPPGLRRGYFVQPTVFSPVNSAMTIAREEIFGPVLAIIPYQDEEEAIALANDTRYGLAAYVQGDPAVASRLARRLRAGVVSINGATLDPQAPFGGYKQSGNGREWGSYGLEEYLEIKSVPGLVT